jgi:hypothetical protein
MHAKLRKCLRALFPGVRADEFPAECEAVRSDRPRGGGGACHGISFEFELGKYGIDI